VDRNEILQALSIIETRRVLPVRDTKSASSKGGIIPSREDQWFRYERSVALSIEESLSALPGVLDARVHVNLPDEDPLFGESERRGGSGSVLLVVDRAFAAGDDEVAALVGGAAGIPREVVRVLKSEAVETSEINRVPLVNALSSDVTDAGQALPLRSFAWWILGGSVFVGGCVAAALRYLRRRPKRKVTFALPKELDFEV
jgi:type III secretory pathway lipoprotein EscJ